ncbi:MAG: hypothetical protein QXR58_01495 [Candidatus Micrarchaeaceae archaeon]
MVVYVPCEDGIVLAADSGFEMNYTEETSLMRRGEKIRNINDRFLFSGVGSYSVIDDARELLKSKLSKTKKFEDIKAEFLNELADLLDGYIRGARRAKGLDPDEVDKADDIVITTTLILAYYNEKEGSNAIVISDDLIPTVINNENNIRALGFGLGETVVNLELDKYKKEKITIWEGCFIAYKVINDAMARVGGSLLGPISIYTMSKKGIEKVNDAQIAVLEEAYNEIGRREQEHVRDTIKYLREDMREKLRNGK